MVKISPGIMYNLVGISSGAPIAIELTRQLETQGYTVALLIAENPLAPLQRSVCSNEDLQATLLHTLNAQSPKTVCIFFCVFLFYLSTFLVGCLVKLPSSLARASRTPGQLLGFAT